MDINVRICHEFNCIHNCHPRSIRLVPDDCPYVILHALDEQTGPIALPRRSGKTTALVRRANTLITLGHLVYYLTHTLDMGDHVKRNYNLDPKVHVCSVGQGNRGTLRGLMQGKILTDEVQPQDWHIVQMLEQCGFEFDMGYYTPWA